MFPLIIFLLIGTSCGDKLPNGRSYSSFNLNGRDASLEQPATFGNGQQFQSSFSLDSQDQEFSLEGIQNGFDTSEFTGNSFNGFEQSVETGFGQDSAEFQRSQFLNGFRSTSQFYSTPSQQDIDSVNGVQQIDFSANGNGRQNGIVNGNGRQNGIFANGFGRENGVTANGNGRQNGYSLNGNGRQNGGSVNGNGRQNGVSLNGNGRQNGVSANGNGRQNGYSVNGNGRQNGATVNGNGRQNGFSSNGNGGQQYMLNGRSNGRSLSNGNGGRSSLGASPYGSNGMEAEEPACKNGEVMDPSGKCVEPDIIRNLYIYKQPEMESNGYEQPMELPKPKVKLNVVVINSASQESTEPIIIPPPQEKTLVLVLNKDNGEQRVIEVPENPASQPEVFFVEYNEGDNPELPGGLDLETALQLSVSQNGESSENGNSYSAPSQSQQSQNGYAQMRGQSSSQNGNGQVSSLYSPPSSGQHQNGNQGRSSYGGQAEEQQTTGYGGRQMIQSRQNGNGNGGSAPSQNGSYQQQQASVIRAALSAFIPDPSRSDEGEEGQYGMPQQRSGNGGNGHSVPAPQAPAQRQSYFY